MNVEQFSELVEALYAGPLEAEPWVRFLERLRVLGGSMAATLMMRSPRTLSPGYIISVGIRNRTLHYRHFFLSDPFQGLPDGRVMSVDEVVPAEKFRQTDFYRQYLGSVGVEHVLGADVRTPSGVVGCIRLSRTRAEGEFGPAERGLLEALVPHIRQASELFARLDRVASVRSVYAGTFDLLSLGVLILDRTGRVLEANSVGEALAADRDGLEIVGGILTLSDGSQRLRRAVETIANVQVQDDVATPIALRVDRPSGRAPLGLIVRTAPHRVDLDGQHIPTVAVFISDPARAGPPDAETVGRLFGLTQAEATLSVLLASGLSLDEAAEQLGVSRNTVRTHLRAIFAKTGSARQADLVRTILRSVATLGGGAPAGQPA